MKIKVLTLSLLLIFYFNSFLPGATQEEILKNPEKYPELQEYRQIFFENLRNQELDWLEKAQKFISEYNEFVQKYPTSEFVDEAKLRIAEFYELSYQKKMALPYLNDIIQNHPNADYFTLVPPYQSKGTKTAAWAFYYRGLWFLRPQSIEDWKKVIENYPESKEAVGLAKSAISKYNYLFEK